MKSLSFRSSVPSIALALFALSSACEPGNSTDGAGASDNPGGNSSQGGAGGGGAPGSGGNPSSGGSNSQFMVGPGGNTPGGCMSTGDEDADMDGFTVNQGDCNDCDKNTNPGAIEVVGEDDGTGGGGGYVPVDEDCDGTPDNPPEPCDTGLALDSSNAEDAARAMELCKHANTDQEWGVVAAQFVRANGGAMSSTQQNGILPNFGPNVPPRGGQSMFSISSGRARIPGQPGACGSATCVGSGGGTPPSAAYPQNAPGCDISDVINDDVALELTLRAPTNATGYSFDFKFYSFEYPDYVCTTFNDQFIALVNPAPMGAMDGNVSFDSQGAPVSVNVAYFTICDDGSCPGGSAEMQGTGFDTWRGSFDDGNAGGTEWLRTQAPVEGGSTFSIRFGIWDTGDTALDSTAVIDNFQWLATGGTVDLVTEPPPPPM
ncbi:MAG: hypothetical protein HOW73_25775 [Polyangiaceae bacterium]|nr:hypothetical protein [Polyangiaceae bacterium]